MINKQNILKYAKIITINIFFILLILFIADFLTYNKIKNEYLKETSYTDIYPPISYIDNYKEDYSPTSLNFYKLKKSLPNHIKPVSKGKDLNKKSILIFGCSFTYGTLLNDEQSISNKLSSATNRTVYNFGIEMAGIQHMYFLIKNYKVLNQIINPEYVIYIYIPDHIERLIFNPTPMSINGFYLKYKLCKDNSLKLIEPPFLKLFKTFLIKSYYHYFLGREDYMIPANKEYNAKLATQLFIKSKEELEKKYPDTKFIILKYEIENDSSDVESDNLWSELEKEGFIIVKSSDLIGRKYKYDSEDTVEDSYHPSEYAWNLLTPKLVEKFNL